jgi:hypothetical protein
MTTPSRSGHASDDLKLAPQPGPECKGEILCAKLSGGFRDQACYEMYHERDRQQRGDHVDNGNHEQCRDNQPSKQEAQVMQRS